MKTSTCKQCGKLFEQKNDGKRRFCSECIRSRDIAHSLRSYYRRKYKNPELLKQNHRRWKQHQRGFDEGNPTPWRFDWSSGSPLIKDANGCVVCTLSTGTLEGVYSASTIIANANRLLHFNE